MTIRSLSFLFATLLLTTGFFAQSGVPFHCGNNELHRLSSDPSDDPARMAQINAAENELENFTRNFTESADRGGSAYVIPVVFHIIHNNGPENIDDAQIYDVMRILNEDFNMTNPDWDNVQVNFLDRVGDIGVEFRLATKDPSGNCTNGITRTISSLTNEGGSQMKGLIVWPRNKYVNVWVAASANGAAGYTFRPGSAQGFPAEDGIVLEHSYTGSIGTGSVGRSRTLTHEMGHFFNLKHTWGDGNDPELSTNCNQDDDVTDTPNTIGWTECNLSGSSCGSLDNVENYMDYSYCSKMFTVGQGTRMIAALNSSVAQRSSLWQTNNLNNTGTNGNSTICAARFSNTLPLICAGGSVTFTDQSYHNVTSREWSFPGGSPATSTQPNPTVSYNSPGLYSVTLMASDGSSNVTTTTTDLVRVWSDPGQSTPFQEGFEGVSDLTSIGWSTGGPGTSGFTITSTAAYTGSKCAKLANTAANAGGVYNLYAPTVDLSNATTIDLEFRFAYAQRQTTNNDRLRVYVSNDCGETWSLRTQLQGLNTLTTAGVITGSFIPNNQSQWGQVQLTNINSTYRVPDFRLRFEFQSEGGNNLYIDDVNINGMPVGLEELLAEGTPALMVLPNPATEASEVVLNLSASGRATVDVIDVVGRTLTSLHEGVLPTGTYRFNLPITNMTPGVYFVRLQHGTLQKVSRFVVQ